MDSKEIKTVVTTDFKDVVAGYFTGHLEEMLTSLRDLTALKDRAKIRATDVAKILYTIDVVNSLDEDAQSTLEGNSRYLLENYNVPGVFAGFIQPSAVRFNSDRLRLQDLKVPEKITVDVTKLLSSHDFNSLMDALFFAMGIRNMASVSLHRSAAIFDPLKEVYVYNNVAKVDDNTSISVGDMSYSSIPVRVDLPLKVERRMTETMGDYFVNFLTQMESGIRQARTAKASVQS